MHNGGEYTSKSIEDWMGNRGIQFTFTAPDNPESNWKAEILNRKLNEEASTMLSAIFHYPGYLQLWAEAVQTLNYLRDILYKSTNQSSVTQFQSIYNTTPNFSHVRVFGCETYVHQKAKKMNGKLGPRSSKRVLVGL